MKHTTAILAFAIAGMSFGTNGALAASAAMKVTKLTSQPIGHYEYCQQYSSDCNWSKGSLKPVKLTKQKWRELVEINSYSNTTIKPVTDYELYNKEEHWTYPTVAGDCEDYVLMKRHMLMQRGWPSASLLATVVRQPNGEGHAVLTVRTSKGDFILDNLNDKVLEWRKTEYKYLKRQSVRHSGRWADIADNRASVASID